MAGTKMKAVGHQEFVQLHVRYETVRALLGLLPSGVGGRVRALGLRLVGFRLARGVILADVPRIGGTGAVYGRLTIGWRSYINVGCYFDLNSEISIGQNVALGHEVMILTATHALGDDVRRAGPLASRPVTIADGAWIGARALILPGVAIGRGAIVGAGSVVTRDVPPNAVVAGVPARTLSQPSLVEDAALDATLAPALDGRLVIPAQQGIERAAHSCGHGGEPDTGLNSFAHHELSSASRSLVWRPSMGKKTELRLANALETLAESVQRLEGQLQRLEPRSDTHASELSDHRAGSLADVSRTDPGELAPRAGETRQPVVEFGTEGDLLDFVDELSAWSEVAAVTVAGAHHGVAKVIVELADPDGDPTAAPTVLCIECGGVVLEGNDAISHGLCDGCRDAFMRAGERTAHRAVQPKR